MKVTFNSPIVLIYTAICILFFILDTYIYQNFNYYVSISPFFDWNIQTYLTYIFAHINYEHLIGNLTFILLIGPLLEWKYGSINLLIVIIITAIVTGVLNKLFFETGLLGASGIVFLFITLSSFTNNEKNEIPLTFILVFLLFIGKEVYLSFTTNDGISQFAHIIGGLLGGILGFFLNKKQTNKPDSV